MRPRAAGDIDHRLDGPFGEATEAVGEEIHLLLAVHVEGDLVVARRRIIRGHLTSTCRRHVDRGRSRLGIIVSRYRHSGNRVRSAVSHVDIWATGGWSIAPVDGSAVSAGPG